MLLIYVDDVLCLSHDPEAIMKKIGDEFEIKDGVHGKPERYLGAGIEKFTLPSGKLAWSMHSKQYV